MKEPETGNKAMRKLDKNQKTKKLQTVQLPCWSSELVRWYRMGHFAATFLLYLQIIIYDVATMWWICYLYWTTYVCGLWGLGNYKGTPLFMRQNNFSKTKGPQNLLWLFVLHLNSSWGLMCLLPGGGRQEDFWKAIWSSESSDFSNGKQDTARS